MKVKKKKTKRKAKLKNLNQLPGEVVYVGDRMETSSSYELVRYDAGSCEVFHADQLTDILSKWDDQKMNWLTVIGLSDTGQIEAVGKKFNIHPLVLEDLVNTRQRPKLDEYENYIFLILKMAFRQDKEMHHEHLGLVLGPNYIISFQEVESPIFEKILRRLKTGLGQLRTRGSDYLLYSMMDVIVDNYFLVSEKSGTRLERLEDAIFLGNADDQIVHQIQNLKPEIFQMRRAVFPLREIAYQLEKTEHTLISTKSYNYFRDVHDNAVQVAENVEMYREMLSGIMDMYISTLNNKMNEVMKVLTIVATIFIPLTFIVGVYGMNFTNMPELDLEYGYYYVWGVMLLIILGMMWYFKRKKWL